MCFFFLLSCLHSHSPPSSPHALHPPPLCISNPHALSLFGHRDGPDASVREGGQGHHLPLLSRWFLLPLPAQTAHCLPQSCPSLEMTPMPQCVTSLLSQGPPLLHLMPDIPLCVPNPLALSLSGRRNSPEPNVREGKDTGYYSCPAGSSCCYTLHPSLTSMPPPPH